MIKIIHTLMFPLVLLYILAVNWFITLYYLLRIEWVKYKFAVNESHWKVIFKSKK